MPVGVFVFVIVGDTEAVHVLVYVFIGDMEAVALAL